MTLSARAAYRFTLVGSFAASAIMTVARAAAADRARRLPLLALCQLGAAAFLERGGSRRLGGGEELDWTADGALLTFSLLLLLDGRPLAHPALFEIGRMQCAAVAALVLWIAVT